MQSRLRTILAVSAALALVIVALTAAGCPKQEAPAAGGSGGAAPAKTGGEKPAAAASSNEEYVMIGISTGAEYWNANKAGLEDACAELGVKATFTGPTDQNPQVQADQLDQIIAGKPAGILIAPGNEETLTPGINAAMAQGIPVICVDTDAPKSDRIAYFGTSNYEAGVMGARTLGNALREKYEKEGKPVPDKLKVAISSRPGQWNLDERERGYRETFEREFPEIDVIQTIDDATQTEVGSSRAKDVINANADIAGFAGLNAVSGPGVAAALRDTGREGDIIVVAMDADSPILDAIEQGVVLASIAQRQYYMSYIGVLYLYGLNHGFFCKPGEGEKTGLPEIPEVIDTGTVEVNASDVEVFRTPSQGAKEELAEAHPEWLTLLETLKSGEPAPAGSAATIESDKPADGAKPGDEKPTGEGAKTDEPAPAPAPSGS
jgi:ribose transport system substrate-binding protein